MNSVGKILNYKWIIPSIIGSALIIAFLLHHLLFSYVFTINGDKIPAEEFQIYMLRERASVITEMQYDTSSQRNKTAIFQLMLQHALQQLILNKVQWQKSKSLGLFIQDNLTDAGERIYISGSNYAFFQNYYKNYHEKMKNGKAKPGPEDQNKEQLYTELMHRIELALKVHLMKEMKGTGYRERLEYYNCVYIPGLVYSADIQINQPGVWFYKTFIYQ